MRQPVAIQRNRALWILLGAGSLLLTLYNLSTHLPMAQWWQAVRAPDADNLPQLLFHFSLLPRVVMALLVGAGLGLAGMLFQQTLRNPLAEPATLGISAGAQLGATCATLWALPVTLGSFAAFTGAMSVGALLVVVTLGRRFSPFTLILAGMMFSLGASAINQLLAIFYHDQLQNLFSWHSGSLEQQSWSLPAWLWPRLLFAAVSVLLLCRPLALLALEDSVTQNLGLHLQLARMGLLLLAITLSALLVHAAGIISFIGLFAPLSAKFIGIRRILPRVLVTAVMGALLLCLADQAALWLSAQWQTVAAGTLTAIIGVPLFLCLVYRLPTNHLTLLAPQRTQLHHSWRWRRVSVPLLLISLLLVVVVGLSWGRTAEGWLWARGDLWQALLPWRGPRLVVALLAGSTLGVAGCVVQRLTGNPMASPEVLGISAGAACGMVVSLFFFSGNSTHGAWIAASVGALLSLGVILALAGRGQAALQRMLLVGVALNLSWSGVLTLLLASGDPRMLGVLTWLSGSTYATEGDLAWRCFYLTLPLLLLALLTTRWLTLLPLGANVAQSLGVNLASTRLLMLLLAAALTAAATLTLGPLSFVGLMAPHIARLLGFYRAAPQIMLAGLIGALLMGCADWCGRMLLFPDQIPAGIVATLIGTPWFIWLLRRACPT